MIGFIMHYSEFDRESMGSESLILYRALFRGLMAERYLTAIRVVGNNARMLGYNRFKSNIENKSGRRMTR